MQSAGSAQTSFGNTDEAPNLVTSLSPEQIQAMIANMTMRTILLSTGNVSAEVLDNLNEQLQKIPNIL